MSETDTTAYGQSWYAATMVDEPRRSRLAVDLDVDVCVIGGGLAGLTTAREIARSGWSVVVLEAGRIASGASGRNTGFVLPGFAADADKVVGRVGFDRANSRAVVSPARPPPITQTSTSRSTCSAGRRGASTTVAAYQLWP